MKIIEDPKKKESDNGQLQREQDESGEKGGEQELTQNDEDELYEEDIMGSIGEDTDEDMKE